MEGRNLLAEKDMYQLFEFTFLRQLVLIVREVTRPRPRIATFGRNYRESPSTTCSGETIFEFIKA
jgi:hypothetical protein